MDSAGQVLEAYSFLGAGTIVQQTRPESGVDLSLIQQTGHSLFNNSGGDRYVGLDRYGEVIDQNWVNSDTDASTDRFQYAYDADGNVLYENNLYYSQAGQVIEEKYTLSSTISSCFGCGCSYCCYCCTTTTVFDEQQVWGEGYVDDRVLRNDLESNTIASWQDMNGAVTTSSSGSSTAVRLFVQQDANYNVTALTNTSGIVQERFVYDPYT